LYLTATNIEAKQLIPILLYSVTCVGRFSTDRGSSNFPGGRFLRRSI